MGDPTYGVSRYRRVCPDTGWIEIYEIEWGEGPWMLVATYPIDLGRIDADGTILPRDFALEVD